jgi:CRP/FNR family transcriptional regulator, anaerobic regulatory protein
MSINKLIESFSNDLFPLSEEEINQLKSKFKERRIKRRQLILQEGDVCKHYTFVSEGCLKLYKIDQRGKERNLQFAIEDEWISDLGSLYSETPSDVYIEALEQSTILQIEVKDLVYLYTHFPNIDRRFRVVIENSFIYLQKRMFQNISATAEEKYLFFFNTRRNLFNRISNVQIASYLGVTPEFLSTIRKKIANS